ncbi:MAG: ATPase, partial [Verrucomicrobia bacterium]|nr:ATPase [Verrucomicrobiota bacterium]
MSAAITHYIRAGYPGLYVVSAEELRVEAEFKTITERLNYGLHFWSVVDGLVDVKAKTVNNANDPLEALEAVKNLPEKSVVLLKDFHLFLADPNPILLRKLKDTLLHTKLKQKLLVILGCRLCLPPELEHELTIVEFKLP